MSRCNADAARSFPEPEDPLLHQGRAWSRRSTASASTSLRRGEVLGLVGESGSGKSVTGFSIIGLVDPPGRIVGGSIRFPRPRPGRTADEENLRGPARPAHRHDLPGPDDDPEPGPAHRHPDDRDDPGARDVDREAAARQRARDALGMVGIASPDERLKAYPHQFSGGMRQRVAIAIALLNEPELIIADEPTTALDVTIQAQILHEVQKLCRETGTALIWITHDLGVARLSQISGMTRLLALPPDAPSGNGAAVPRTPVRAGAPNTSAPMAEVSPPADCRGGMNASADPQPPRTSLEALRQSLDLAGKIASAPGRLDPRGNGARRG